MKLLLTLALLALCACGRIERKPAPIVAKTPPPFDAKAYAEKWERDFDARVEKLKETPQWRAERKHWDRVHLTPDRLDRLEAEVKKLKRIVKERRYFGQPYYEPPYTFTLPDPCLGMVTTHEYRVDTTTGEITCVEKEPRP